MSFDSGPLDRYLSSAFGDDPAMARDLRAAFVESARDLADLMRRARCDEQGRQNKGAKCVLHDGDGF